MLSAFLWLKLRSSQSGFMLFISDQNAFFLYSCGGFTFFLKGFLLLSLRVRMERTPSFCSQSTYIFSFFLCWVCSVHIQNCVSDVLPCESPSFEWREIEEGKRKKQTHTYETANPRMQGRGKRGRRVLSCVVDGASSISTAASASAVVCACPDTAMPG